VAQELVTEAGAFRRAFDQARDVGDDEALRMRHAHDAEVRMQGRERIVRDLRTRIRHGRDERRLAGVRHAQQAHVGQHLQFEAQLAAFAVLAVRLLARRAVGRRLEVDVAPAALAALGQQLDLFVLRQVGDDLAGDVVDDQGADRHAQVDVFGALAVAIGTAARLAVARRVDFGKAEVDQRVDVAVGDCVDRAAAAAVAAVRTAERAEFLAAERGAAVAAVAGDDFDACFVDKLHDETTKTKGCVTVKSGPGVHDRRTAAERSALNGDNAEN
jgi:hypothetical protein